jgi:hypothetical protein
VINKRKSKLVPKKGMLASKAIYLNLKPRNLADYPLCKMRAWVPSNVRKVLHNKTQFLKIAPKGQL